MLNDSLFIDKSPVTNIMYLEFINHSQESNPHILEKIKVKDTFTGTYKKTLKLMKSPKYSHHPVLLLTYWQANLYCKWRSDMVQFLWDSKLENNQKTVYYSLPTINEYNFAYNFFSQKNLIEEYKGNPYKNRISKHPDNVFVTYDLSEMSRDSFFLGKNWKGQLPTNYPNDYTTFRCICTVVKKN